ncbi:Crp/Fnr family transcriptional regulator [Nostoc sp. FACHB-152]|uniref:Crp/Fnr family transcriptional regulator n=1 Tax=unclassified Nostoc TaxID=2593658 RepID=UPI00168573FD|nr:MULTISPECIES: Crp/Fnr family transcriptional regulator [unclassified Nostoc]MBD2447258.1 Crp/Fnr family transcriptional regulator [Nostoc sp. FACHB-152]MBD2468141.1 Crp/Fnr family transcriptional regulator [Nostoc sp. FACHB-145]
MASSSLASTLPPASVSEQLQPKIFARKETIPPRNDILWRIERGAVRTITWSEDGTYITLGYWGPGDVVGSALSKVQPYQIECLTSVEVSIVPSYIWHQDIDALFTHIQHTEELLSIVHLKPISLRLWKFLVWLSDKFGRNIERDKVIDINITHQEIAEVLNTTRVTITRLLQQFEEEGVLLRYKRQIILRLPNKFTKNI